MRAALAPFAALVDALPERRMIGPRRFDPILDVPPMTDAERAQEQADLLSLRVTDDADAELLRALD